MFAQIAMVAVVGVLVGGILIAGISALRPLFDRPPAVPVPTPTKTLEPAAKPAQLFDGDCESVLTLEQLQEITGADMELTSGADITSVGYDGQAKWAVTQSGGLVCEWRLVDSNSSTDPAVYLAFMRQELLSNFEASTPCLPPYTEFLSCAIEHETGGLRVSGGITAGDEASTAAAAQSILDAIDARVAEVPVGESPAPVEGAWANPTDCAALLEAMDSKNTLGRELTTSEGLGHGSYWAQGIADLVQNDQSTTCMFLDAEPAGAEPVQAGIQGGGSWVAPLVAERAGAKVVTVAGFDYAVYIETADGMTPQLHAFRGPNWISTSVLDGDVKAAGKVLRVFADALDK